MYIQDPKTGTITASTMPYAQTSGSRDMTKYEVERERHSKLLEEVYQNVVSLGEEFSKALLPDRVEVNGTGGKEDREAHSEAVQHLMDANERLEVILSRIFHLRERYEL